MMRMTKLPDGWYVATPETEEEREFARRWKAAYYAFQDPEITKNPTNVLRFAGRPGSPKEAISYCDIIDDGAPFHRAWMAAFNAFMEEWERGLAQWKQSVDAEQLTDRCTSSGTHGEDPSQCTDDLSHEAQT